MDRQTGCKKDVTAPNQTEGPVVVGIGASAGGLEAVQRFLKHMPQNSGMAFVVVQHLDPGMRVSFPTPLLITQRCP